MSNSQSLNVTDMSLTNETQMVEQVLPLNTSIPSSSVPRLELGEPSWKKRRTNKGKKLELGEPSRKKRRTNKGKKVVSSQEPEKARSQKKGVSEHSNAVTERAEQIKGQLPGDTSFIKYMLRSHVTGGFWLGLPLQFCNENLPKTDQPILLVGEGDEAEYKVNFIAKKKGLSGGWRRFSLSHKIAEGDAAVFQLIQCSQPFKFKVYIVRRKDLVSDVDRALSPPNIAGTSTADNDIESSRRYDNNPPETSSLPLVTRETNRLSTSFVDVQNFETGLRNSGIYLYLTDDIVHKYYNLCRSQSSFLHQRVEAEHPPLTVASTIAETVEIAETIRACNTGTPQHTFKKMEKTLLLFEGLGMEVGFLVRRVRRLARLAPGSRRMYARRDRLDRKIERNDSTFGREAAAPW